MFLPFQPLNVQLFYTAAMKTTHVLRAGRGGGGDWMHTVPSSYSQLSAQGDMQVWDQTRALAPCPICPAHVMGRLEDITAITGSPVTSQLLPCQRRHGTSLMCSQEHAGSRVDSSRTLGDAGLVSCEHLSSIHPGTNGQSLQTLRCGFQTPV